MKKRTEILHMNPVLVELILVTLFLGLSCSVILQLIAGAWEVSDRATKRSEALILVEDALERTKADPEGGGDFDGGGIRRFCEENGDYAIDGAVQKTESAGGALYEISVSAAVRGEQILVLTTSRYVADGGVAQ